MSIKVKFAVGGSLLALFILIASGTGYFSLMRVRSADHAIKKITEIRRLILEMDRGMEKARRLHGGFFLYHSQLDQKTAHVKYAQPSIREIARVVSISEELKRKIFKLPVNSPLRKNSADLNLYFSSAKRFADTSIESFELAPRLTAPDHGLENRVDALMKKMNNTLKGKRRLFGILNEIEHKTLRHRLTRKRFLLQSAFNEGFELRQAMKNSVLLDDNEKQYLETLLDEWKLLSKRVQDIYTRIEGNFKDFALQNEAVKTVSMSLIHLADNEVIQAQEKIDGIHRISKIILFIITFLGFLVLAIISKFINVGITRRILDLTHCAKALRKGHLDVIAKEGTPDELGELGRTFNVMAIRIKTLVGGLEKEVEERTLALVESEKRLEQSKKMEAIGLLAGGVAHDLNNILSGIVGFPELLLMDIPEDSPLRKPVLAIHDSGKRATAVVADLLTVARGVANTKSAADLSHLVEEYLESPECQTAFAEKTHVPYRTKFDAAVSTISCSPVHIKKCIMNLMTNALEAMEGDGEIFLSTTNRTVDGEFALKNGLAPGQYVVLDITDTGGGISAEDLEHIFEPFYTKKVMGRSGTGLGLAVVWNTMQDHNGTALVESSSSGTTVSLYFPTICPDADRIEEEKEDDMDLMGNGETVLIIDDESHLRHLATSSLKKYNYDPVAVSSGEDAVEYVQDNPVDLLLLDMIMDPGINGRETYERIVKRHPDQRALIVSGFSESDDVVETLALGAHGFLKKPYELRALVKAVKQALTAT